MKNLHQFLGVVQRFMVVGGIGWILGMNVLVGAANGGLVITPEVTFPNDSYPAGLVVGPADSFWVTLSQANVLAAYQPPAAPVLYPLPTGSIRPHDLVIGPDKALWFTERVGSKIGQYAPGGAIIEHLINTAEVGLAAMVSGQDGALWFTEFDGKKIGRLAQAWQGDWELTEYTLPSTDARPFGICSDLEGNLWYTDWAGYRVGKVTLKGEITEFPIPAPPSRPIDLIVGSDGSLWVIYNIGRTITRLDPQTGAMNHFTLVTASTSISDLIIGPEGQMWFIGTHSVGTFPISSGVPGTVTEVLFTDPVFSSYGRSQIISGPAQEVYFVTANSQVLNKVSASAATGVDVHLFITKKYPFVLQGGNFIINADVVNYSEAIAHDLIIELTLDANIQFVSASVPGGSCVATSGVVQCQVATLAGKTTLPISFTLLAENIAEYQVDRTLILETRTTEADYLPANNRAVLFMEIREAYDYFIDFNKGADSFWSKKDVIYPTPGEGLLGLFSNDIVTLDILNLPMHDRAMLCFDLFVLGGWDGSQFLLPGSNDVIGPDIWANYINEERMLVSSFSNQAEFLQAYPSNYPEDEYPAMFRAKATGILAGSPGLFYSQYYFCTTRPHTLETFKGLFQGLNLDAASEFWAIDNVRVKIFYNAAYSFGYLPLVNR